MENASLPPATQAVLDALTDLGHGTVPDLAEKSGKARSTTERAIKTLADAGLIVQVDTGPDTAEGTPARWTLAAPTDNPSQPAEPAGTSDTEPGGNIGTDAALDAADHPAATDGDNSGETGDDGSAGEDTAIGDLSGDDPQHPDETAAPSEGNEADRDNTTATVVQPSRTGDRKVMAIKAVLADYGDDGVILDVISTESGIGPATVARLLTAMEQADAARRVRADAGARPRWIAGPTKASDVDPNPAPPRCPTCGQVIRSQRTPAVTAPANRSGDATLNTDGSRPFARGELEQLTLAYLVERPGQHLTPQEIAAGISAQLGGREISGGAVRNNCTKAAAAGRILLVSDVPLTFTYPGADSADDQRS